ncbi:hypothetical protein SB717_39400, partial [Priestia sp. SIMBA_032]|uniref:hypothetical protein n=1 Tax=Priestia sp. SIMBA_032 TaxID=3085775 RepID=UPI00397AB47B
SSLAAYAACSVAAGSRLRRTAKISSTESSYERDGQHGYDDEDREAEQERVAEEAPERRTHALPESAEGGLLGERGVRH